jgi:ABC-type nitrate/sulfonate/bicarbonate transport system permease component
VFGESKADIMAELLFWMGLGAALWFSWVLFRDLGDVPQLIIPIPRDRAIRSWYQRHRLATFAVLGLAAAVASLGFFGVGDGLALGVLGGISAFLWFCGYIHPHIMMRPQQRSATFVPVTEVRHHASLR